MPYSLFNGLVSTIKDTAALFSISIGDAKSVLGHICSYGSNIKTTYQEERYWTTCLLLLVMCVYLACIAVGFFYVLPMWKGWLIAKCGLSPLLASVVSKRLLHTLCKQLLSIRKLIK